MPKLPPKKKPPIPPRGSKNHAPSHAYSDGKGGVWAHPGRARDCRKPECVQWHREQHTSVPPLISPNDAPWGYSDEHVESWAAPLDRDVTEPPEPPDPLAPCPLTGREHRWRYGDDGKGHSGSVCKCGAYEE